jgi:dTDP-4-dehydrorhamnose 3,5-epimerase
MKICKSPFQGILIIEPKLFEDSRGFFLESFQVDRYRDGGMPTNFIQDNHSRSSKGVLRGMHFQINRPQAQIVTVIRGHIYDVCVDLRFNSSTFGDWYGIELFEKGRSQIYMEPGFAHGFCVLSDWADIHYKVSEIYNPLDEGGIRWDDPDVNIVWPIKNPIVSDRDSGYPSLKELKFNRLETVRSVKK